ncbi:larval cuticle protein LCP-17-like [Danaus plexippus]|uniref:larval cuticle protein LCP-17-like n=1 Tax=Danaus plexippus TaxID=13037 RepID=UPI0013C427C3|nr:larval cuticle protein LCP-17-like [Danaus plexippus plexippus]XP_061381960.1 larval cuticle protein LCP-17-like [Danaus plexippus]
MKLLLITLVVAYASADVSHILVAKSSEANAKILKQELDVGVEGQYLWSYETDNGISAREQGALKNVPGADVPAQVAQGEASWTAPNGEKIQFQYTADENGYQAQGPYIPTPPPIPVEILRGLEFIRNNPPAKEN